MTRTKLIHEGEYFAEVRIEIEESDGPWSPCVSVDEARTLDEVRLALRRNDTKAAACYGTVYRVTKVAG